ncbi:hypothetical protein [Micromonospora echinofusca]|uniref:hypothetical protein n=1 Tax=Micromonospora echinofusca TaxID=47858 RepID=UPI0033D797CA
MRDRFDNQGRPRWQRFAAMLPAGSARMPDAGLVPSPRSDAPPAEPAPVDAVPAGPAPVESVPVDAGPMPVGAVPAESLSARAGWARPMAVEAGLVDGPSRSGGGRSGHISYAVLPVLLGLAAAVALAAPGPTPVGAAAPSAPACPTTTPGPGGTPPAPAGTPSASATAPAGTPSASATAPVGPSPSPSRGGIVGHILDGVGQLSDGGRDEDEKAAAGATPSATPSLGPTPTASGTPTTGPSVRPTPTGRPGEHPTDPDHGCVPAGPKPSPIGETPPGTPLPRIAPDPGQPVVAAVPSKLTGSKVTMYGLRFEGIVDLPTADGRLRALKFTMDRAVTDDFLLRAPGPAGRTMRFATDELTVQGDVAFYATRFVGRLLGVEITLTPDLPLPDGLPVTSPVPITFTDPAMDLAYVSSDTLTAQPALKLTLP